METIRILTSHNVTIEYQLASLGDRIIAAILDQMVQYSYLLTAFLLLSGFDLDESIAIRIIIILLFIFYPLLCEIFLNGQTIGKRAISIKVIRLDGNTPTLGGYFLRWLFGLLETAALPVIAILTVIIRGKGQRLGDVAAGSCVVKVKKYVRLQASNLRQTNQNYQVIFPQVTQLNDRDINIIKEVIFTYRRNRNTKPVDLTAQKVKHLLVATSDLPPLKFLETVVRDYNFITSALLVK